MPLVRIDVVHGTSPEYRAAVADTVYHTMVEVLGVPEGDRFQVIAEHDSDNLKIDRNYLGIERSDAALIVNITLREGRDVATKKALYRTLADALHARVGLRKQDVFVALVETAAENWSFGNGEAQYG
jgi:4-oxalocrotonate tautomerase